MKELLNVGNGALVFTEQAGDFTLAFNKDAMVGGGAAAGIIEMEGAGKVVLKGKLAFDLGMKIVEAHSPAPLVAIEEAVQGVADAAISQM